MQLLNWEKQIYLLSRYGGGGSYNGGGGGGYNGGGGGGGGGGYSGGECYEKGQNEKVWQLQGFWYEIGQNEKSDNCKDSGKVSTSLGGGHQSSPGPAAGWGKNFQGGGGGFISQIFIRFTFHSFYKFSLNMVEPHCKLMASKLWLNQTIGNSRLIISFYA